MSQAIAESALEAPRPVAGEATPEDAQAEPSLRPRSLDEYIGQTKVTSNLKIFLRAARARREALDHVLFYGPPGLGKTTLANIIAAEMQAELKSVSAPAIERGGDLAALLTNLQEGEVLFIDEIHRLRPQIEEVLYPAMEDYQLDVMIGQGTAARSIKLDLPKFTLVGATTRAGLITAPLRGRFGIVFHLDFYSQKDLEIIVHCSAEILGVEMEASGASEMARRALDEMEVDKFGLDEIDRKVLATIIEKFDGGPVGVGTISASISEERESIEEIIEPYLIQIGFLNRTPRGRVCT